MDKKTIIGFLLIAIIMSVFMRMNSPAVNEAMRAGADEATSLPAPNGQENLDGTVAAPVSSPVPVANSIAKEQALAEAKTIKAETDLFEIEFSTYGATIKALKLKDFQEDEHLIDMVMLGDEKEEAGAFLLYLDKDNFGEPFYGPFAFEDKGNGVFEFKANAEVMVDDEVVPFEVVKTFTFKEGEYLFKVDVAFTQPEGNYLPLNFNGYSYTLESAPQVGASFKSYSGKRSYRQNIYLKDGKRRREITLKNTNVASLDDRLGWAGISEKYFVFLGVPNAAMYRQLWTEKPVEGLLQGNQFAFARAHIQSASNTDTFYFYVGPRLEKFLQRYNKSSDNAFEVSGYNLGKAMDESRFLLIFERILKALLTISHNLIGNWGWSILLVTFIVKLLLFPLSLKGMLSTAKMTELQPKLTEIQKRYKGDARKLQEEQMKLYSKEGVNPVSGCLPLIIQMPILIAMYQLFNKYFDFRGAPFIGWITDLSQPDLITTMPFTIPVFIGNSLRLLPIIYVITQLFMNKVTQANNNQAGTPQAKQMKMMMTFMPIFFFFVLYDMPSGLLLYWIFSNIFSLVQQLIINNLRQKGFFNRKKTPPKSPKKIIPKGR